MSLGLSLPTCQRGKEKNQTRMLPSLCLCEDDKGVMDSFFLKFLKL